MDKYTVDLDQVLNDFEYSELTDQRSRNVSERLERPRDNVPFQPPPVTKHSINNVFHSLNEYLNSSTGTTSLQDSNNTASFQINDNNFLFNKPEEGFSKEEEFQSNSLLDSQNNENFIKEISHVEPRTLNLQNNAQEIIFEPLEANQDIINPEDFKKSVSTIKTEIKDFSPDFSLLETEKVISESFTKPYSESLIESELTNVNIDDSDCDRNGIDKTVSLLVNEVDNSVKSNDLNENKVDILVNIEDDNVKNLENFVIEPQIEPLERSNVNTNGENLENLKTICVSESSNGVGDLPENSGNHKDFIIETLEDSNALDIGVSQESPEIHEEVVRDQNLPLAENEQIMKKCIYKDNEAHEISNRDELVPEANVPLEININTEHLTETNIDLPQSSSDNAKNQTVQVISFSANIDIDDGELNKMLEDLELEENKNLEAVVKEAVFENSENSSNKQNPETFAAPKEEIKSGFIDKEDSNPDLTKQETNNVESKPLEEKPIECQEMERPIKTKKKSSANEKSSKESITTVIHVQETLEQQSESEKMVEEGPSVENKVLQDSSNRPQDLPLNNEVKDDNVGRKINLIGSPGSTPYNNVYINKSIEPKTHHNTQEIESDCTSSASPTFSDCSTESTSTASTVSVEDVPNNANKFIKQNHGDVKTVKNTNVELSKEVAKESERNSGETANDNDELTTCKSNSEIGVANLVEASMDTTTNISEDALNNAGIGSGDSQVQRSQSSDTFLDKSWLGKEAPLWIPDADAATCLHCDMKFTVLKRRHHCRACGLVLCSKCCNLKFRLEYLEAEARVCNKCYDILNKNTPNNASSNYNSPESGNSPAFRPNPNNPLEYCSTVSPLQQAGQTGAPLPSVMVPVGVLKRKGSNKKSNKSVMFCDGIAPGSDLTNLDQDFNYNSDSKKSLLIKGPDEVKKKDETSPTPLPPVSVVVPSANISRNQPKLDEDTGCFIPKNETSLPPTITVNKTDILYSDCYNAPTVVELLKNEALTFAINPNLFVQVKVINMSCCINKQAWCFCTEGLINVGSDEVVYLIEYIEEESFVPKDIFFHVHNVYNDAVKGTSIKELGLSLHNTSNFLDSKNHAGFVYIKPTFQCLEHLIVPKEPYLIGILIHRWETPWAKLFPLRLILRLGAEYRYYPSPLISTRHRDSVFVEIGHTIINLLADFRNFTYSLPQIRGLIIHMEDKKTTITIPRNRYDQVIKSINNSSEHILAFAGNFSAEADSHLVCIQDTQSNENCYTTHAINIHNKPRKVTGASFIVFNGSLKSTSGLTAKSNIVEDGLMIQVPPEHMDKIRDALRNMQDHTISCGCVNADSDESVNIVWGENDVNFNVGVNSPVDLQDLKGIPSIRVHNGKDYPCTNGTRLIRWTEVFILKNGEENPKNQDPVDISKVSESIAKACCTALVKYLDLLVSNSFQKVGVRATLHVENVSYSAGSNGFKLPPIYMRSLDNELIPVLHRITSNNLGDNAIVLELVFRILNA